VDPHEADEGQEQPRSTAAKPAEHAPPVLSRDLADRQGADMASRPRSVSSLG
jgi:hypothetical protein